ncbi:MAG: catechol 2,3-dioxygenase-like lactoylglutathione lyase family enzyme [Candidatus Azotimanducaceae bacterium]|jgi:catechol 2,3-dioxygenase-like lactoylglutathione lyase family enzyme
MALAITKDSIDLGIITTDAEKSLVFYRDTLGLAEDGAMDMPGGGKMVRLSCGTTTLKIVVNAKEPKATSPVGGIGGATGFRYFTISVSNLKEATDECAAAGYKIAVPAREIRAGVMISIIEDPDGNWVELLQMG